MTLDETKKDTNDKAAPGFLQRILINPLFWLLNNLPSLLLFLLIAITIQNVWAVSQGNTLSVASRKVPATDAFAEVSNQPDSFPEQWLQDQKHIQIENALTRMYQLKHHIHQLSNTVSQSHQDTHSTRDIIWTTLVDQIARMVHEDLQDYYPTTTTQPIAESSDISMPEELSDTSSEFLLSLEHLIKARTTQRTPRPADCVCS
ncbi:hypothetical protein BDF19DRAFT_412317 [Syncephalis fuscata]|nr:hypothetical protein BDF19DRAFT_412317 [Syncephalis fuscata]